MKNYNAVEMIAMIFTISVCLVIVISIGGMVFGGKTTADNTAIRGAFIDLLQYITGGVFGAMAAIKSENKIK